MRGSLQVLFVACLFAVAAAINWVDLSAAVVSQSGGRVVARAHGPAVSSIKMQDGHRLRGRRYVQADVRLDCDCSGAQTVEFLAPTCDCGDVGRVTKSKNGRMTIEFKNGDHVHVTAKKDKKTGEVKVKVDHDD